jgi:uncharacterized lipoprotein YmbA
MKNHTITCYVWLNDKDSKKQEINTIDAFKIATKLTIDEFGGGTIHEGNWIYTHENGEIVIEKTLIIELITDKDETNFVNTLKKVFNQESVLVKKSVENINFL